jgi:hypothetical protein
VWEVISTTSVVETEMEFEVNSKDFKIFEEYFSSIEMRSKINGLEEEN